ncbi:helicase HerA domain-containing protein, partial [Xenorhabdus szentirmaii]
MTGGQEITLTPDVLKKHIGLVGTTGSGKTITIKTFLEYAILKKQAGIFIDAKGDMKLAEEIRKFAEKHKRPFYHFNTDGVGMHYNPLAVGTPTELTDKILTLSDWSEEHYKLSSQEFLQY